MYNMKEKIRSQSFCLGTLLSSVERLSVEGCGVSVHGYELRISEVFSKVCFLFRAKGSTRVQN